MNNEPVAWMIIDVDNGKSLQFKENKFSEINIPLYTAPRELSDKEIEEIWKQAMDDWTKVDDGTARLANQPFVFFARAILKKASEK